VKPPEVEYARSDGVSIAYQVIGDGPIDLLLVPFLNNLEYAWAHPLWPRVYERLAVFSRVIMFDKRGTGLSDRFGALPTLEVRMDDLRAVLDDIGSERAALVGSLEGNHLAAVFAATYPERTSALVLYDPVARFTSAPDYEWGPTQEEWTRLVERVAEGWGRREFFDDMLRSADPTLAKDEEFCRWYAIHFRLAASPGSAAAFYRMMMETDIREVLPAIRVPTLVCYREDYRGPSMFVAERIPSARAVEFPGIGYFASAPPEMFDEIERFLSGRLVEREPDRVLLTLLFTDIVGSTELAASLGDQGWRTLLEKHDAAVRRELGHFRGREVNTTGDGFLCHVRRAGEGDPLRLRDPRRHERAGAGGSRRPAHGGMRARPRRRRRHRRPHGGTSGGAWWSGRGARLEHGEGPRCRLGASSSKMPASVS
jgi:pimeloyl-ACP methyl ester carboxylesterase